MNEKYRDKLEETDERIISRGDIADLPVRESYYLNNWYRYKENLKSLKKMQLENARKLFKALKELDPEDRNFLATKYDRPTIRNNQNNHNKVHPSDIKVAEELGVEGKEYTKKRRVIQQKLKLIMQEQKENEI